MKGRVVSFKELCEIVRGASPGDWLVAGGSQVPNGSRGCSLDKITAEGSVHSSGDNRSLYLRLNIDDVEVVKRSDFRMRIVSTKSRHDLLVLHHRRKKEVGAHVYRSPINWYKTHTDYFLHSEV